MASTNNNEQRSSFVVKLKSCVVVVAKNKINKSKNHFTAYAREEQAWQWTMLKGPPLPVDKID